jgi:hypothetical protein
VCTALDATLELALKDVASSLSASEIIVAPCSVLDGSWIGRVGVICFRFLVIIHIPRQNMSVTHNRMMGHVHEPSPAYTQLHFVHQTARAVHIFDFRGLDIDQQQKDRA